MANDRVLVTNFERVDTQDGEHYLSVDLKELVGIDLDDMHLACDSGFAKFVNGKIVWGSHEIEFKDIDFTPEVIMFMRQGEISWML